MNIAVGSDHAGYEAKERKVRPRPQKDLVVGDLDLFGQDPQRLIAGHPLVNQTCQDRIIEKLFDPGLG